MMISLRVDGIRCEVEPGTSVAVAIVRMHTSGFRRSVSDELRGPLCGMGICFECRATVDGRPQRITCQMPCRDGMEVVTDAGASIV